MFDKKTYRLLKALYHCEKLSEDEINNLTCIPAPGHGNKHVSFLLENHMIEMCYENGASDGEGGFSDGITTYRINLQGRAFVEKRRRGEHPKVCVNLLCGVE